MNLPPQFVLDSTLGIGVIYKLNAPELITTDAPHHFIVVAIDGTDNYLVLCTTQRDKKIEYLTKRGYDLNTLAYVSPNNDNGLTSDTYINCNDYHTITRDSLLQKIGENQLTLTGRLSQVEYSNVRNSINLSRVNDLPTSILIHPTETK